MTKPIIQQNLQNVSNPKKTLPENVPHSSMHSSLPSSQVLIKSESITNSQNFKEIESFAY